MADYYDKQILEALNAQTFVLSEIERHLSTIAKTTEATARNTKAVASFTDPGNKE